MRAEGGSPNLINGVSRQAPEVRLPSQLQESVNQFPTVTRGLVPRNPVVLKGRVSGAAAANTHFHFIDRDPAERYTVRVSPSGVMVHTLAGVAKTVAIPNGIAYLAGVTSAEDYEVLTVADYTFIVNKKKVAAAKAATSAAPAKEALIHVASGEYHTHYKIVLNGATVASFQSEGGPYGDVVQARYAEKAVRASAIVYALVNGVIDPQVGYTGAFGGTMDSVCGKITGSLADLPTTDWEVTRYDNVIHLKNKLGNDFTLSVDAAGRETAFRAHKGMVIDFSELPRKSPDGFKIRVAGSEDTNHDDYYVEYDQGANDGAGRWVETIGPSIPLGLDPVTMPHILVREADGTFTFKVAPWVDREVGDLETNPWPSFVGKTIQGFAFEKNRLALLSGESPVFSRAGEYFNFFIETILTTLDTDVIDASIAYEDVSTVYHAVSHSGQLIVFTASIPFRMASGEIFSQKTANFVATLTNKTSPRVKPVSCGSKLFFVNDAEAGCFVHEFINIQDETIQEAPSITEHVNGYVPTGVFLMDADEDLKLLVMVSASEPNSIYVYKWLSIGQEKAQSAWQKWTLPAPVKAIKFIGEELVVALDLTTAVETVGINCHEAWSDGKAAIILLDRRITVTGVYNAGTAQTTFTTTYPSPGAIAVLNSGDSFGFQPTIVTDTGTALVVAGDYGGQTAYVGFVYQAYGIMSPFVYRPPQRGGGDGPVVPGIQLKVSSMRLDTGPSCYLDVTSTRAYRVPYVHRLSAALVGTKTSLLGSLLVGKLVKSLSIMADADDVTLRFENSGPYPYSILSYRWSGGAYAKGY